jgi:two-component system, NarL family, nitrate/nitrite response regulator NarL
MRRTQLLLVDDHILFRDGLARLLAAENDLEIVGVCGTTAEALNFLARQTVDVVLLDFDLGEEHGTQFIATARVRGYEGKVLMVTAGMSATESSVALRMGASGIFLKHNSPTALASAIRAVAAGELWVDPKVVRAMAESVDRPPEDTGRALLTEREQKVLRGILEGLTNKEIAARLGVTEGAIKATLQQLFHKTRVRTRSQLVRIALEGSFSLDPQ